MRDRLVTASAADGTVALVAGITTQLVAETRKRHDTSPTASVAIGRLVTAAALVGANLKGRERLSLQVSGSGTIGGIVAEVMMLPDHTVGARAYAHHPKADVPPTSDGRFNVAELVGRGKLLVTKSYEVGQPYTGIVNLITGEIASDVAAYFAYSEQVPSVVAVGVHLDQSGVRAAGGVIAHVLPGADDETIGRLEYNANAMDAITSQILAGAEPEAMIERIAAGMPTKRQREYDVIFACRCTREKVETALLGLGHDELVKIAQEQPTTEATCEFCKRVWKLSANEVSDLAERIR
ncbi:MAG TPA: Hsp33 family molecular chaperone HslO [Candidatus Baltobacteraceae bacterium]